MRSVLSAWIERAWYDNGFGRLLLWPLTLLYSLIIAVRRWLYRIGVMSSTGVPAPVIVVGNIVAGGAGKTPVTLYLAQALKARGMQPGIISRGYGRQDESSLLEVTRSSNPAEVGDEPLLLARRSGCAVFVGRDRVAAARLAIEGGADVLIADDGLQHYRLRRDFEICVVDGSRGLGNGLQLPAGPLREPASRLATVDVVMVNVTGVTDEPAGVSGAVHVVPFSLEAAEATSLDGSESKPLEAFAGAPVDAVAGIGNPERFFRLLERHGLTVVRHPLPDHAGFDPNRVAPGAGRAILVTEKDAVKLDPLTAGSVWYVPVELQIDDAAGSTLLDTIETRCRQVQDRKHE
jgi:tetraacyldisaccharide 4'-kinase